MIPRMIKVIKPMINGNDWWWQSKDYHIIYVEAVLSVYVSKWEMQDQNNAFLSYYF